MAQLIQMRQRIKAIETIKKITHAMRLISMSAHSQLKRKEEPLTAYLKELHYLFQTLKNQTPAWINQTLYPSQKSTKRLVILVGSQKGLAGNFNTALFKLFEQEAPQFSPHETEYIVVGKKACDYIKRKKNIIPLSTYDPFSLSTLHSTAHGLAQLIMNSGQQYTNVIIFSNKLKTFFFQKPHQYQLIPFTQEKPNTSHAATDSYVWMQDPQAMLDILAQQYLEAIVYELLFQSILAEQAARFLSMDGSTRNAEALLETTQLYYNKLRQAKITRELSELTGSI